MSVFAPASLQYVNVISSLQGWMKVHVMRLSEHIRQKSLQTSGLNHLTVNKAIQRFSLWTTHMLKHCLNTRTSIVVNRKYKIHFNTDRYCVIFGVCFTSVYVITRSGNSIHYLNTLNAVGACAPNMRVSGVWFSGLRGMMPACSVNTTGPERTRR